MKSLGKFFYVEKVELKQNFTQIPNSIFKLTNLSSTQKLVLIYLFSNAQNFRITNYRITEELKSDYRTIKRALTRLTELKYITKIDEQHIKINVELFSMPIFNNGNSTSSTLTPSNLTNSNCTSIDNGNCTSTDNSTTGNSTSIDTGQITSTTGRITSKPLVELQSNNNNTIEEQKEEEKEEEKNKKNNNKENISFLGLDSNSNLISNSSSVNTTKVNSNSSLVNNTNSISKINSSYTINQNEKINLFGGYGEFKKDNENTKVSFYEYEDIIMFMLYVSNSNDYFQPTKTSQLFTLINDNPSLLTELNNSFKSYFDLIANNKEYRSNYKSFTKYFHLSANERFATTN